MQKSVLAWAFVLALPWPALALEVEAGASRESLNHDLADWRSVHLEGEHKFGDRRVIYGTLRNNERFGLQDSDWLAGFYHPLGALWTLNAEAGASPTHRVLPAYTAAFNLTRKLDGGWGLGVGGRDTRYTDARTDAALLSVERYLGDWRAAYTFTSTRLVGAATSPGHRLQLNRYYGERSTFGMAVSHGQEAENVPPVGVISTEVSSLAFFGRHWLGRQWAVSYEASLVQQGSLYTRKGLRFGLRRAF